MLAVTTFSLQYWQLNGFHNNQNWKVQVMRTAWVWNDFNITIVKQSKLAVKSKIIIWEVCTCFLLLYLIPNEFCVYKTGVLFSMYILDAICAQYYHVAFLFCQLNVYTYSMYCVMLRCNVFVCSYF